jgi:hypothetical protein
MSREGLIGLAVTVTIIHFATRGFPVVTWLDAFGIGGLALIGWWILRTKPRYAEGSDQGWAFRLGQSLRRVRRGTNG